MESHNISIIIILICMAMSAYFSATETAFSSLNRIRVKKKAEDGNKKAAMVLKLEKDYDRMLSTILIGNNLVNIGLTSLMTILFVSALGEDMGASVSTIVTTVLVLIFCEVSPKSIAKEMPESFAMFSAPLLRVMEWILEPLNLLFAQWKKVLSILIKTTDKPSITEDELIAIVEEAENEGGIDQEESVLIRNAIEFNELEAIDILTPRTDIEGVYLDDSKEEIAKVFADTGFSRLPVFRENVDDILGILYQKDFYNFVFSTDETIESIIRPTMYIAKGKKIGMLLKELQKKKLHIAVVIDEFGGTVGIITLEDILEEIVGEIWDEHDEVVQEIRKVSEREYIVLGSASVEKLFELLEEKEEFDVVSVSGWVMNELDHIPAEGDSFRYHNLEVSVLEVAERRAKRIRIRILEEEEQGEKGDE